MTCQVSEPLSYYSNGLHPQPNLSANFLDFETSHNNFFFVRNRRCAGATLFYDSLLYGWQIFNVVHRPFNAGTFGTHLCILEFYCEYICFCSYKLRIESMLLKEEFAANMSYLEPSISAMIVAANGKILFSFMWNYFILCFFFRFNDE